MALLEGCKVRKLFVSKYSSEPTPLAFAGEGTARLEALADGAFAIAITLLSITLLEQEIHGSVWETVWEHRQAYFAYFLSFILIGMQWINHHAIFQRITKYDTTIAWLNIGLLAGVAMTPFAAKLVAENSSDIMAVGIYAFTMGMVGIFSAIIWQYAKSHNYLSDIVCDCTHRITMRRLVGPSLILLISIPLSLFTPGLVVLWIIFIFTDKAIDLAARSQMSRLHLRGIHK